MIRLDYPEIKEAYLLEYHANINLNLNKQGLTDRTMKLFNEMKSYTLQTTWIPKLLLPIKISMCTSFKTECT